MAYAVSGAKSLSQVPARALDFGPTRHVPKCAKIVHLAGSPNLEGSSMTEKLQRTEQVITEAELRKMLDDEDDDSFADLISKGVAQVRGGAWRREQDGHWRFWRNPDWSPPDEDYP